MRFNNWLTLHYKVLKKDPYFIIRRPYWIFLLPLFIYIFIRKRWKTDEEIIYLIETELANYHSSDRPSKYDNEIIEIYDFTKSLDIIRNRITDEDISDSYLEEVRKRFERGDYLVLITQNNMPASFLFISEKTACFTQVKYELKLDPDCFAIYDVYTFREYRGKGLYQTLIEEVMIRMKKKNYRRFWLWIMKNNKISIFVHNKLGINHVIRIFYQRYRFGLRIFYKKNVDFYLKDLIE